MANANVPEAIEPSVMADAGDSQVPVVKGDPSLTSEAAEAGAIVPDETVETVTPVAEASAPQPSAVQVPQKAKRPRQLKTPQVAPAPLKTAKTAKPVKLAKLAKPVRKPAAPKPVKKPVAPKESSISHLKDKIMATKNADFAKGFQDVIADVQGKAKAAFEKSTASLGDVTEFTKGNVEALVESGKIFTAGAQNLGTTYVAESRAAFETLTADVKELAAVKNPTDFFKLQGDLARRNFDAAVSATSKNSEAMLKLFNEAFAPISGRVSLAVEKVKQAG